MSRKNKKRLEYVGIVLAWGAIIFTVIMILLAWFKNG